MDQKNHRIRYFAFPLMDRDARLQAVRTSAIRSGAEGGIYAIIDDRVAAGTPARLLWGGNDACCYLGRTCSFATRTREVQSAIRGGAVRHSFADWLVSESLHDQLGNMVVVLVPSLSPAALERFAVDQYSRLHGHLPPANRRIPSRPDGNRHEAHQVITWEMLFPRRRPPR